jgi:F0F1-type ATP synthase membrane subunit b/b'
MSRVQIFLGRVALLILLGAAPLLAQEESTPPVANSPVGWIFRWVNFAIVFGGIAYYAVKKGGPYFRRNAETIAEKIAEGTQARTAAEERKREIKAKLARLDEEIERMRTTAKRDSEAEVQRLRAMAREDAERIEVAAQGEIAAAGRASRLELKALAARLTIEHAESLLKTELDVEADAALVRVFAGDLAGRAN